MLYENFATSKMQLRNQHSQAKASGVPPFGQTCCQRKKKRIKKNGIQLKIYLSQVVCPSPKWMTMIRICRQLLDNNFVCLFVCRPYLSAYIHTYICVCFGLIENLHKINFNWKSCLGQFRKLSEQLTRSLTHSLIHWFNRWPTGARQILAFAFLPRFSIRLRIHMDPIYMTYMFIRLFASRIYSCCPKT